MSLYIRLSTNFFSHIKTLRLKAAIGNDAFWVPPKLWVYAAEHQPDGILSNFSAEELAMLVGYQGDAQAMLQALLRARFLDEEPLRIHGWDEHNGFHKAFAIRASKAAKARWKGQEKTLQEKTVQESTRHEMTQALLDSKSSNASSIAQAESIFDLYPRKTGRTPGIKAIQKSLLEEDAETLLEATKRYADSVKLKDPQFIPHCATFFNQKRWKDPIENYANQNHRGSGGNRPRLTVAEERNSHIIGAAETLEQIRERSKANETAEPPF